MEDEEGLLPADAPGTRVLKETRVEITDLPQRVAEKFKLDPVTGCWVWTASLCKGYGQVGWEGRVWKSHRLAYTLLVGPIPAGLVLDHFECDNPPCGNPEHLRPSLHEVNSARVPGRRTTDRCIRGHEWTPENTLISGTSMAGKPRRHCRACMRIREENARTAAETTAARLRAKWSPPALRTQRP